jgi:hypothetical protein
LQLILRICALAQISDIELSLRYRRVRTDSQIATALAVCELISVVIFNDVLHFSAVSACIYKTRTKKIPQFGPFQLDGIRIAQLPEAKNMEAKLARPI